MARKNSKLVCRLEIVLKLSRAQYSERLKRRRKGSPGWLVRPPHEPVLQRPDCAEELIKSMASQIRLLQQ
jgi:hypothetical protein